MLFFPLEARTLRQLLWMAGKQWSAFFPPMKRRCQAAEWRWMRARRGGVGGGECIRKKMCTVSVCLGGAETTWNQTSHPTWACAPCMPLWDFASGKAKTLDLSDNLSQICNIMWPNQLQSLNPPCVQRGLGGKGGVTVEAERCDIFWWFENTLFPEWGLCFESWQFGGIERNTSVALETGLKPYFLAISVISNLTWCSVLFHHLLCQGTTYNLTP